MGTSFGSTGKWQRNQNIDWSERTPKDLWYDDEEESMMNNKRVGCESVALANNAVKVHCISEAMWCLHWKRYIFSLSFVSLEETWERDRQKRRRIKTTLVPLTWDAILVQVSFAGNVSLPTLVSLQEVYESVVFSLKRYSERRQLDSRRVTPTWLLSLTTLLFSKSNFEPKRRSLVTQGTLFHSSFFSLIDSPRSGNVRFGAFHVNDNEDFGSNELVNRDFFMFVNKEHLLLLFYCFDGKHCLKSECVSSVVN